MGVYRGCSLVPLPACSQPLFCTDWCCTEFAHAGIWCSVALAHLKPLGLIRSSVFGFCRTLRPHLTQVVASPTRLFRDHRGYRSGQSLAPGRYEVLWVLIVFEDAWGWEGAVWRPWVGIPCGSPTSWFYPKSCLEQPASFILL